MTRNKFVGGKNVYLWKLFYKVKRFNEQKIEPQILLLIIFVCFKQKRLVESDIKSKVNG